MRRLAPLGLLAAALLLAGVLGAHPAAAACAHDSAGRCQAEAAACNPPADGRCSTVPGSSLSKYQHACRCLSPRQWGPLAGSAPSASCRQRCSTSDVTCESSARTNGQRSLCSSRNADCNSHC
jgi:hypothetical protein